MAMNWNFLSKKREDDSQFLSQDYQPPIPHSKINLEQRFGLYTDSGPENQYENWRSYDQQLQNNSRRPRMGDKIYENQLEMQDNACSLQRSKSIPNRPPPLPPRNNTPSRFYNTTTTTPSRHHNTTTITTPSRHHNTTININASTNIGGHNQTLTGMFNAGMDLDTDDVTDENDTRSLYQAATTPRNKYHSHSSSALSRNTVNLLEKRSTFNQTFAAGDNIYCNLTNADDSPPPPHKLKKINSFLESLQGNVKESKPRFLKLSSHKFTQAVQGCRTAITTISQKFRASTQKRYKLDSSSPRANSYGTPPPGSIRRTPGKLYSPFNCATPPPPRTHEAKRLQHRPSRLSSGGQENRHPRTPRGSQHLSVAFAEPFSESLVHSRLGPHNGPSRPYHHRTPSTAHYNISQADEEVMDDQEESGSILEDVYCGPRFASLNNTVALGSSAAAKLHLNRNHWGSFHASHNIDRQVITTITPSKNHRRRSVAASTLDSTRCTDPNVLLPPMPPARRPIKDVNAFQRHLVEFDQMSRNITVSLGRNSKLRSSVR